MMSETKNKFYNVSTDLILLFVRLTLATVFITAGWGKLQNLQKPIEFFATLGVPMPSVMAPTVATFEFFCGILLLLGLKIRLSSLPIIGIMSVAIITAKMNEIETWTDVVGLIEFLYIILALILVRFGGGRIALDQLKMLPHRKALHA